MGSHSHKQDAPVQVTLAILSMSSTRTRSSDDSGNWIRAQAESQGHTIVAHQVIPDEADKIMAALKAVIGNHHPNAVIMTGGTGISPADVTIEAVRPLFVRELTAFSALFAMLSHQEIGSAALLSRATAGIVEHSAVFCIPGSLKACQLACNALIFPELGHLAKHLHQKR